MAALPVSQIEFPIQLKYTEYIYVKFIRKANNGFVCLFRNSKTNEIVFVKCEPPKLRSSLYNESVFMRFHCDGQKNPDWNCARYIDQDTLDWNRLVYEYIE